MSVVSSAAPSNPHRMGQALHLIDLEAYSRSPRWVGHFDAKQGSNRRAAAQAANEHLVDYLARHPQPITVSTSLVTRHTEKQLRGLGYKAGEARNLYAQAVNRAGLITCPGPSQAGAEADLRHVPILDHELKGLLTVTYSIMAMNVLHGGFQGHFFIAFEHSGLVVYPHDDCGYGVFEGHDCAASQTFLAGVDAERFDLFLHR